ncbi:MULE domain-containing protein [Trichonephila inaurata madagascariensis]|uniref:MULE domain-containing protein n=1 Tax=Trichonephila inaurata madagascariensis TaxID=2747483 RepID=A0A8X6IED3_9ARAC|nr:MULE domain-containing protein [Trichonephila inaurata madagascariensis]
MNYHCCRSGTFKPKGKGLKNLKSQGSAKIGISCPAVIKVRQSTENVVVQYFPKHQNHETQLEHLRLSESDSTAIAEKKLLLTVAERCILKKKDIHNIKRDFNINGYVKRHEVDAVSVRLWAQEMKNNGENCIVFFKEHGQLANDYCLKDEDFVLVIMIDFQKEMITKYGKDKICINGTHGLSSYDFNLYSVLVVDKHKNGIPVAFCFSNRSSEDVFKIYFSAIKITVGKIETTTFMTDDAPAFYNAWT